MTTSPLFQFPPHQSLSGFHLNANTSVYISPSAKQTSHIIRAAVRGKCHRPISGWASASSSSASSTHLYASSHTRTCYIHMYLCTHISETCVHTARAHIPCTMGTQSNRAALCVRACECECARAIVFARTLVCTITRHPDTPRSLALPPDMCTRLGCSVAP